jgi:serine phosphatase RsbU (regulator of sigma subunit)/putative methionine-R-sulfoxide reductase with GAF domain
VSRERGLILYCALIGAPGWIWLAHSAPDLPLATLALFVGLALLVETTGFRVPPADPYSLVAVVLVMSGAALGPADGALIAGLSGLAFGALVPFFYGRPRSFYLLAARPFLRGGVRAAALLLGGALGARLGGGPGDLFLGTALCYPLCTQLNRAVREYLQGGNTGLAAWWRSSWRAALSAEVLPLPAAWIGAQIYTRLGALDFALACGLLLLTGLIVRRATFNLRQQRRSVRELALLNQVSRAIIRAEMDVAALCDLIYREASKVVDTSSFHLGLFAPSGDQYTLMVRVQDRVRLPMIQLDLPAGDGIIGWMRETGRALLVEDFTEEMEHLPARPRYQSDRPPRAGIYVPLMDGETVIGSISIQSYRPRAFDADDMRLLSLIADQAAVAISKARAFDNARQRAVQLQAVYEVSQRITAILDMDELLPSVVGLIRERFGYHPVHIFTLEPDGKLSFRASTVDGLGMGSLHLREGRGIVGAAAASSQAVLVNDVRADPRYISDDEQTRSELAVPLRFGDECIGVLDAQSSEPDRFSEADLFVMQTLAGQIATAIESARAFSAQREEAWILNGLLQVAANLASASTLDELLPAIVRLPPLLLGCQRCYCILWHCQERRFTLLAAYGLAHEARQSVVGHSFGEDEAPLLTEVCRTQTPLTFNNPEGGQPTGCPRVLEDLGCGALLALPLTARGATLGLLLADHHDTAEPFAPRRLTLYRGIASQIAGALESALLAQEAAANAHLEEELRVARDIQRTLLPAAAPRAPGWEIAADWRSARLVGGDFYDFWWLKTADQRPTTNEQRRTDDRTYLLPDEGPTTNDQRPTAKDKAHLLPDEGRWTESAGQTASGPVAQANPAQAEPAEALFREDHTALALHDVGRSPFVVGRQARLGFVIADVSDKGVPAALFMTLSRSLVRAAALDGSSPAHALERANRWIARDSESAMFVTVFYGILDPSDGALRYACAGHNPPLLVRADGQVRELHTPGIALGVIEEARLGEAGVALAPGDLLVCYTDGVTEAIDGEEEAFGVPRLVDVLRANRRRSAAEVLQAITDSLAAFTGERAPFDDVTLVVIKRAE